MKYKLLARILGCMIAVLGVISSSSYSVGQEKSATPHPDTAAAAYDSAYIACQKLDRPGAMSCECFQQLNDRRDAELNAVYKRALAELDQMGRDLTAEQGGHLRIDEGGYPLDSGSPYRLWFGFGLR